jgi:hypothetical protein
VQDHWGTLFYYGFPLQFIPAKTGMGMTKISPFGQDDTGEWGWESKVGWGEQTEPPQLILEY